MEKARAHVFVSGKVQGVFFRQNTFKKAKELGIFGWVRNLADGRVEAVLEGDRKDLETMIAWLKKGPRGAKINSFDLKLQDYKKEFNNFNII